MINHTLSMCKTFIISNNISHWESSFECSQWYRCDMVCCLPWPHDNNYSLDTCGATGSEDETHVSLASWEESLVCFILIYKVFSTVKIILHCFEFTLMQRQALVMKCTANKTNEWASSISSITKLHRLPYMIGAW